MNKYLYRIFKKVIAIMLALILMSADSIGYVYASIGQNNQEEINQNVLSQEKIDDNLQASDNTNKVPMKNDKIQQTNSEKDQIEEVNQELVVKVGQLQDMSDRDISIPTGETVRIHVTSTGSNANMVGDYHIRMEIDNPNIILSNFQKSDGTIQDEITLDGIKFKLVTEITGKRYIISKLTQGSTHQFDFDMVFKNGVTNDGEKVILKTDILDSDGNVVTDKVAHKNSIIDDITITANSSFSWNNVSKKADKESVNRDNLANIKDESIVYNIKAKSNNKGNTGNIFTEEYTITDELKLPNSISIPEGEIKSSDGVLTIGGKKIIEVSEKNAKINIDGQIIKITYTKKNSNKSENEIEEPNLQVILYTANLVAHKSEKNEEIINKARFEAKPSVGNSKETSEDIVTIIVPAVAPNIKAIKSSTVVGKKGSDVEVGDIIKYEITVENDGSSESNDFVIQDKIPQNTEAINKDKWTEGYTLENNTIKWKVSSLEPGTKRKYVFYVKVTNCDSNTLIKNIATVDNKNTNETINKVVKPLPDISLHKYANDGSKIFKDGEIITYKIEVLNNGKGDSEQQTIVDTMPPGLVPEYDRETNTIKSGDFIGTVAYNESNKSYVITWDVGCIKGDSKIILTYNAKIVTKNMPEELIDGEEKNINITNRVTNNEEKIAQCTVKVGLEGHKINVKKQAECLEVREGQSVSYTLEFRNTGTKPITTNVIDVLPTNKWGRPLTWWSIDGDNATITTSGDLDSYNLKLENGELIWEDVEIESGQKFKQTVILTFPYYDDFNSQFNFNGSKSIVNRLRVNGKQSSTFQIPKDVDLNINKSVDKDFIQIGSTDEVTFTIDNFSNISDKRLKNVTVTDDFSTENGLNSKFNVKEITTGSYEGVDKYKVILKFKDNSSISINIDNPKQIFNLSTMIENKNMSDLKSMTFDFGDLQTDFKVVNGITVVATLKDKDDIEIGSITNIAEMYFNKAKVSDDATVEVTKHKKQNNIWTQKGIKSIGKYTKLTDKTIDGTYMTNNKSLYSYDNDHNAIVYTYIIYNDINSIDNLPLKKAIDILPNGFKYITMSDISTSLKNIKISNQITTVNDTTDINIPQGVVLDKGIRVNANYDNNKIEFTFNEGAELQPGHAIIFTYLCEIDNENANFSSTNKIAFLYDIEDKKVPGNNVDSKFSTNISEGEQNDGSCNILNKNYNNTYGNEDDTWYESSVTVKKVGIFPGISKSLDGFYNLGSSILHKVNENSRIGIKSSLRWTIKVSNDGHKYNSIDMSNYTVIDTLPHSYTLSNNRKYTQNMIIYDKEGKQIENFDISSVLEKSTNIDSNGNEVQVLKWVLADEKYTIPSGGYAEITFVSANDTDTANYGQYVNNATLIPTQSFTKENVKEGSISSIEIDGNKIDVIENQETAHIFGNYSTYSFKQISDLSGYDEVLEEDKKGNGYGDNHANGYGYKHNDNTVNSSGAGQKIGYTLYIKSNSQKDLYNLTLIDKLPHTGDVGTVNLNSARKSEFNVYLANNPNFKVDILDSDRNYESSVDSNMYSIDYSRKTSYSEKDWNSTTIWDTSYDRNIHKSLRVTFNEKFSLPTGKIVRVYFEAYIGDDAIPGETAWNSFGYEYSTKNSFNKEVTLISEPAKVGVSIPGSIDSAQISITKVDEDDTDKILEDAEFGIYSDKDCKNLITKITTTSNGNDLSSKLLLKTYYVKEIKAPSGYLIDDTVYTVNLTQKDMIVKLTNNNSEYVTNKKEKIQNKDVSLYVKKDVSNIEKLKGDEEFTIKVSGEFLDGSTEKYIKFTYNELGTEKIVPGVIYGNKYKISEPEHEGYTVEIDKEDIILTTNKEVITIINTLETLEEPEIPGDSDDSEDPSEPETPGDSEKPEEPSKPEVPDDSDNPEEPSEPEEPGDSGDSGEPSEPEVPGDSEEPEEPSEPEKPGDSEEPEEPDDSNDSEETEKPITPDIPIQPELPNNPEIPNNPDAEDELDRPNNVENKGDKENEDNTVGNDSNKDIDFEDKEFDNDVKTGDSGLIKEIIITFIALFGLIILCVNDRHRKKS